MKRLWSNTRGAPLVFFFAVLLLAAVVGLFGEPTAANAGPPRQDGGDHSGERCADCHLDNAAAWATGAHAIAFARESFQTAWADHRDTGDCLDCHTTEYQPSTGQYLDENVVCEACHGDNPADHPPVEIELHPEAEMCGDCHLGTFDEWRHSPHAVTEAQGEISCAVCHNPHGQNIRADSPEELCLSCHETPPENYIHTTHKELMVGEDQIVNCASCHMYRSPGLGAGLPPDEVEGHRIPDHTMQVTTKPCTDCHADISALSESPLLVNADSETLTERNTLRDEVTELEAEVAGLEPEPSGPRINFVEITQGLIIGLGVGITITWILRRSNRGDGRS